MGKITKNLVNLLRKTAIISTIAIPLSFLSCEPEAENFPPKAELEINPTKGEIPLEIKIKLTGSDLNGAEDIRNYTLNIDKEVINSKTPIDITRTFQNEGIVKISGEVIDSKNLNDKTNINLVEIYGHPFLETSLSLINNINIKYTAVLSRVNKATLTVNREEKLLLIQEIKDVNQSGLDYDKTFNYLNDGIIKGLYEFLLESENLEKKDTIRILNYMPTMGSIAAVNFNEEGGVKIKLPERSDKNPEDNPVPLKNAISLDGKTQPIIYGDSLEIKGLPNMNGNYRVEIEYGSATGGLEKAVMGGYINPDMRIKINPFVSSDENGAEYNSLKTKAERINFILTKLKENNGNNIPFSTNPPYNCAYYATQLFVDSKNLGEKIRTISSDFGKYWLYNNYKGSNLDSIYKNGGTLKDMGTIGAPIIRVGLFDISHYSSYFGHSMNCIITGDDLTKWEDWNFIEPQNDAINVQPGQLNISRDCDRVIIAYPYIVEDKINGNYLKYANLVEFKIENEIPILIWMNNDPNLKIIKQRGK